MDDVKKILSKLLKHTSETKNSLAKTIGLLRSQNLYDIENGKVKKISHELSEKIVKAYPEINRNWLLTGEGEMLNEQSEKKNTYLEQRRNKKNEDTPFLVPFVDIPAQAGYSKAYDHIDYIQTLKKFPILPDVDPHGAIWRYFQVEGDSMEYVDAKPNEEKGIKSGDTLLCSQVPKVDWQENLKNYYTYVVVTDTELLIKDIYKDGDRLILISRNKNYDPIAIPMTEIKQLWASRRHIKNWFPKAEMHDIEKILKQLK